MSQGWRAAFLSDSHLGYAAKCRTHAASGLNQRVVDGMLAFKNTITQIIEADVDLVVHGGDLFHRSWPSISEIVWARQQLNRLAAAGIPFIGNTGNHDAASERGKSPATAAVHDPDRGIHMVTDPYQQLEPVSGLLIHTVSHYGLAQEERLIPEPVEGMVNLFTAHGAANIPGHEIFHCVDSPGEQPIGLDILMDDRYATKLLGHYHGMGEIHPEVWYAGSSIRRGFSDPAGGRGWLLVTVNNDGTVSIDPRYVEQRPQHDLPVIDAHGLSGADVEERIRANIAAVDTENAIIRQIVTNCGTQVRRGIDQPALAGLLDTALMWMPDFRRPETAAETVSATGVGSSLKTAGSSDLPKMFGTWANTYIEGSGLAADLHQTVVEDGTRHLAEASKNVDLDDFARPEDQMFPTDDPTVEDLLTELPQADFDSEVKAS